MTSLFNQLFEPVSGGLGLITALLAIAMGSISLFFGRRLYWIFVGVAGFLLGLTLGPSLFMNIDQTWQPLVTLLIALLFAGLSLLVNKAMIAISGAVGLGIFMFLLTDAYLQEWAVITMTIVAAVAGLLASWLLFDWGLMLFSSIAGASLLTTGFISIIPRTSGADLLIFLFVFMIGFTFQIIKWTREQAKEASEKIQEAQVEQTDTYEKDDSV